MLHTEMWEGLVSENVKNVTVVQQNTMYIQKG